MTDYYRNPVRPLDNYGNVLPAYDTPDTENGRGIINSHIVIIDSRNRNRRLFPNANSFVMDFMTHYNNVYSIELLNVILPIPSDAGTARTDERYAMLRLQIPGYNNVPLIEPAITSQPLETDPPPNNSSSWYSGVSDQGFAMIPLVPNFPIAYYDTPLRNGTFWRKSELRVVKRFFPLVSELRRIQLTLVVRDSTDGETPYPFTAESTNAEDPTLVDENYVLQLEICSKN